MPIDIVTKHVLKETRETFSKKVEDLVWDKDIPYLDAIFTITTNNGLDPDTIDKLLTKELYSKVEREAEKLSLLKTKTERIM